MTEEMERLVDAAWAVIRAKRNYVDKNRRSEERLAWLVKYQEALEELHQALLEVDGVDVPHPLMNIGPELSP